MAMANEIRVGLKAPNFTLLDSENRSRTLKEFLGQEVILVFFISAFTATCTKEVCEFRDYSHKMTNLKAQTVGIAVTVQSSLREFAQQNKLSFPILSDREGEVLKLYGINAPTVLLLNEKGIVRYKWTYDKSNVEPNYQEMEKIIDHIESQKAHRNEKQVRNVVTISRQIGSGGDEIAYKVCKKLGFSFFDKAMMYNTARDIGVSDCDIADFSEDSFKFKSLIDRIFGRKRLVAKTYSLENNATIERILDEERCLDAIQTVINSLAGKGRIVIVGRGGQAILKNKVNVLCVRIIAPLDIRIARIMKQYGVTREEAVKGIEENDKAISEYLQRFYAINWDDPTNYDLVISTARIDLDTAAETISMACLHGQKVCII